MESRISYQELPKDFLTGLMHMAGYLQKSSVEETIMELIKMRVSQINRCAYCLDMHFKNAVHLGETAQRLYSLPAWRECPYYTHRERAALAYAEVLTNTTMQDVDDTTFEMLSEQFTKAEIADLTLMIVAINSWTRLNKAFGTVPGNYRVPEVRKTAAV